MALEIYDKLGKRRMVLSPSDSSTQQDELQGGSILSLSCTFYDCVPLEVNDYVDFQGKRFWVAEQYIPKMKSTKEWTYSVQLLGIESLIQRFLVLKTVDGDSEPIFSYTAPAVEQLTLIVDCINAGMNTTDWKIGEVIPTENLVMDYDGTYCHEGLKTLAEKAGVEYWIEGTTINLCHCEHGDAIPLSYGISLVSLDYDTANNVKLFTRLYPLGSSRNIVSADYGYTRLQLPSRKKYMEQDVDTYGVVDHFERDAFEHIYPRRIGKVTTVRHVEKKGNDGSLFTIYYFKDSSLDFNPNEYNIDGLVKKITFQSGELNGRDFEVNYNDKAEEFEIITQWPYDNDIQLPGGLLVPEVNNEYILYNTKMPAVYYALAEKEYDDAVKKYMSDNRKDVSVYKGKTDYIEIEKQGYVLTLGQRINLISDKYFPKTGYRISRITKISRKVNRPSEMDIEISDVLSQGAFALLNDKVTETNSYVKTLTSTLPGIIKSWEKTPPTDHNLFSAKRVLKELGQKALSKIYDDTAAGLITFVKGLVAKGTIKALGGLAIGENGSGITTLPDGTSQAVVDRLYVKIKAVFDELEVKKKTYVGGEQILSPAGMKCIKVEEFPVCYRCYFKAEADGVAIHNEFTPGTLALCQECNIQAGISEQVHNRFYWRAVIAVGSDYIDLHRTECADNSDIPKAGDDIVGFGHKDDITRQGAIVMSSVNEVSPSIIMYQGINGFTYAGKEVISLDFDKATGKARMRVYGDAYIGSKDRSSYLEYIDGKGLTVKGTFVSETTGKDVDTSIKNLEADISSIRQQTDKQFTIWFEDGVPTLSNAPASEWEEADYPLHEQDLYYNTLTDANAGGGRAYRFEKDANEVFHWKEVTDKDTLAALEAASKAQDTADGKRRVFVAQPDRNSVYDVGDIWVNAAYSDDQVKYDNDMLVCITSKKQGEAFSILHFESAVKGVLARIVNMGNTIKLEILGKNEDGEFNSILSAINLDASGIKIKGEKIELDGTLLAQAILATGLNIANNLIIDEKGNVTTKGRIEADAGHIGGFELVEKNLKSIDGSLDFISSDEKMSNKFQSSKETMDLTINGSPNTFVPTIYSFNAYKNRISTLSKPDTWKNLFIADSIDMEYKGDGDERYGYQYASLGCGHIILDGIVEGSCLDTITFTAGSQIKGLRHPLHGNRILANPVQFDNCIISLPDLLTLQTAIGYRIIPSRRIPFSFAIEIINGSGSKSLTVIGKDKIMVNNTAYFDNDNFPRIIEDGVERNHQDFKIAPRRSKRLLLVYDGDFEYMALTHT